MSLRERQSEFVRALARLIDKADELGYELTLGDGFRDARAFGVYGERGPYGHPHSRHKLRLAIDLNLFKDGRYLVASSDHAELGAYWESLGGVWGGRWEDGNHYQWGD